MVSRAQLRTIGFSDDAIDRAVVAGRLIPIFRGTFAVGHPAIGRHGRMLAAVLACGEGSFVSHGTAAALLGLWERQPALLDVIAPIESGRKIDGIRRRHVPLPKPEDQWREEGVPCTSPSRTIVDVAGAVGEASLRRTIEQAAVKRMLNVQEIDAILSGPRRRGSRQLRLILEDCRRYSPSTRLRSPFEARLLPLLTRHNVAVPECNASLRIGHETFEIDFLWRRNRLAVETDGRKYHENPQAEARDRHRDRMLAAIRYRTWRLHWEDLDQRPEATIAKLVALLATAPT